MNNKKSIKNKLYQQNNYADYIEDISNVLIKYFNNTKLNYEEYTGRKFNIDKVNADSHYVECQCSRTSDIFIFARKIKYLLYEKASLIHYMEQFYVEGDEYYHDILDPEKNWVVYYLPNMYDILDGEWKFTNVQNKNNPWSLEKYTLKYKKNISTQEFFRDNEKSASVKNVPKFFEIYENGKKVIDFMKINDIIKDANKAQCEIVLDLLTLKNIQEHYLCIRSNIKDFTINFKYVKNKDQMKNDYKYINKMFHNYLCKQKLTLEATQNKKQKQKDELNEIIGLMNQNKLWKLYKQYLNDKKNKTLLDLDNCYDYKIKEKLEWLLKTIDNELNI